MKLHIKHTNIRPTGAGNNLWQIIKCYSKENKITYEEDTVKYDKNMLVELLKEYQTK